MSFCLPGVNYPPLPPRPTPETDAYEDDVVRDVPLVFLAGPIKHWWSCWGSPEHERYLAHRAAVRDALIAAGYMTYAPWDAIKGTWSSHAQAINDAGITSADVMVDLTPDGTPAHGTARERLFASHVGTPIIDAPPMLPASLAVRLVESVVGPGHPYEEA